MNTFPIYVAGRPVYNGSPAEILNPWDQKPVALAHRADAKEAEQAVQSAVLGFEKSRLLPAYVKARVLEQIAGKISERKDLLALTICREAGKPIQYAKGEVERAIQTFRLAAAWVWQEKGEVLDLSHAPGLEERSGIVRYFASGPCLLISPFNFPLNLVAHKVAPAIACGNAFVLKPASSTPLTALILAEILSETDYPPEAWSVIPCSRTVGQSLVEDDRFTLLSFTGSPEVGWKIKADAGRKKVILELGGDAAVIVDETSSLENVIPKIITGAYAYAGQICISIQRIIATQEIYPRLRAALLQALPQVITGNPENPNVICGPMIDKYNQERTLEWIEEARKAGAVLLAGGEGLENNQVRPALLENIPTHTSLGYKEAFAPIAGLTSVPDFESAVACVNASPFGLQTGIFTRYEDRLKYAFQHLQVGGIIHNHAPTLRIDAMPYGGIKDSGLGREGIAYACRDMSEAKVLVW